MSDATSPRAARATDTELVRQIVAAIRGIHFGSVEVVIHDSRVVHIERREKLRLTAGPDAVSE